MKLLSYLVLSLIVIAPNARGEKAEQAPQPIPTKQVMDEIYQSLQTVLPYTLSPKKLEDPKAQDILRKNFKQLADKARILPEHTEHHDAAFRYLGGALARDAKELYDNFEQGRIRHVQYLFSAMTDACVACHSRLPAQQSLQAANLFKNIDADSLMLDEKARLYLMTRQFDKSAEAYRQLIGSKEYSTGDICLSDWIREYLIVAIRVQRNFADARDTLEKFQQRPDLPLYIKRDIGVWKASLDALMKMKKAQPNLANVRKLVDKAKNQMEFPLDQQGLIYSLYASSLLHEFVQHNPKGVQAAEAYYLLGMTEAMSMRSQALSANDFYLETAIRSAPASRFAEKAYTQLEDSIMMGYSGSSGTHIPEEIELLLMDLRQLMKAAKNSPAGTRGS